MNIPHFHIKKKGKTKSMNVRIPNINLWRYTRLCFKDLAYFSRKDNKWHHRGKCNPDKGYCIIVD